MTKRIATAKAIEHAANFKLANCGLYDWENISLYEFNCLSLQERNILNAFNERIPRAVRRHRRRKMTTQETKTQINMQKIHNARTKRAVSNLENNEKILARYGGMYTKSEINLFHDLHPYFTAA